MQIQEQPQISDHFDDLGLREGDSIEILPVSGRKKKFCLNRTKIDFVSENLKSTISGLSVRVLGSQKRESFHVRLQRESCIGRNQSHKLRYLVSVEAGGPIRLNGNYVFNAYVEVNDRLDIGFNRILFKRDLKIDLIDSQSSLIKEKAKIVTSQLPILIEGETGVGKTSLAKKIHEASGREGRFVHINISSFASGLIESEMFGHVKGAFTGAMNDKKGAFREASRGTLFIDEIDSLPLEIQTKLLIFLDHFVTRPVGGTVDYKVDLRIIFSSGSKLENLVEKGLMRKDFFFRISQGYNMKLTPLRDDPKLIQNYCHFFEQRNHIVLSKKLVEFYESLLWPGNFRQLKGHLERKLVLASGNKIDFDYTDEELICQTSELQELSAEEEEIQTLATIKTVYAFKTFLRCKKNYTKTALALGISTRSLRTLVQKEEAVMIQPYKEY